MKGLEGRWLLLRHLAAVLGLRAEAGATTLDDGTIDEAIAARKAAKAAKDGAEADGSGMSSPPKGWSRRQTRWGDGVDPRLIRQTAECSAFPLMLWLKRLNFMETAKLEMELMKAFEAGEDLDAKLSAQAQIAAGGDAEETWKLAVWQKMLTRIRKMEDLMKNKPNPNG